MTVTVHFYSYYKELTGCADTTATVSAPATLRELVRELQVRFPRLAALENTMLLAVGVEYQPRDYILREGDAVALFPPVQGG